MNKTCKLLFIFLLTSSSLFAQNVELTPFSGYTFKSSLDIRGGEASLADGLTNGLILGIGFSEHIELELLYSRQETEASAYSYLINERPNSDAVATYGLIGLNRIGEINPALKYFGGLKIGVAALTSNDNKFGDIIKFGVSFGGGLKYYFTEKIGLRFGANLYAPVTGAGAGLWFSNQGASVSVSTYSPIVQFNLQGGLIIGF